MKTLTYATVCSGIECMSAAAIGLPLRPIFFSEIEPFPCAVLKAHYPDVPNLGDMSGITLNEKGEITNGRTTVAIPAGGLDILAGGTPCQDVSNAGKRRGMQEGSGTRSSLAFEFVRLIRELRPRYVVWENVAGVLSDESFPKFLRAIADRGYGVAYRTLDAQYVRCADIDLPNGGVVRLERAVPQRRRRVWVVGCAGEDIGRASEILFEPQGVCGDRPPRRIARQGTAESARGRARLPDGVVGRAIAIASNIIGRSDRCGGNGLGVKDEVAYTLDTVQPQSAAVASGFDPYEPGGVKSLNLGHAGTRNAIEGGDGRSQECVVERREPLATHNFECYANAQGVSVTLGAKRANDTLEIEGPISFKSKPSAKARGIGEEREVSPTETAQFDGAVCFGINANGVTKNAQMPCREECAETLAVRHQGGVLVPNIASMRYVVRRLTPTECERLQGLPDGWTLPAFAPGEITDALVAEFVEIFDTFGAIMAGYAGKPPPKPKTAAWTRTWLERVANPATCPDAPRYKACGNGWATNQPRWILMRLLHFTGNTEDTL